MRIRNRVIVVHLDEDEYRKLNKDCKSAHMSREEYLRELMNNAIIHVRDPEAYRALSKQLASYERNINQIAHVANATGRVEAEDMQRVQSSVAEIMELFQEKF